MLMLRFRVKQNVSACIIIHVSESVWRLNYTKISVKCTKNKSKSMQYSPSNMYNVQHIICTHMNKCTWTAIASMIGIMIKQLQGDPALLLQIFLNYSRLIKKNGKKHTYPCKADNLKVCRSDYAFRITSFTYSTKMVRNNVIECDKSSEKN